MKRYNKVTQFIGRCIWDTAEYLRIDLGKYAPIIFGWMVGSKGKKIN